MPKSPATMLYGGARDSSESEEDSSSTGWSDKDDSSSSSSDSSSDDSSSEEDDPLPPPASADPTPATAPSKAKAKPSATSAKSPPVKATSAKATPSSPKAASPKAASSPKTAASPKAVSPDDQEAESSDTPPASSSAAGGRADVAPTMPPKRVSKSSDMYKRSDSDEDDSSSSSSEDSYKNAQPFSDDNSQTESSNQLEGESGGNYMSNESGKEEVPKRKSLFGMFGRKKRNDSAAESKDTLPEAEYVPYIGTAEPAVTEGMVPEGNEVQVKPVRKSLLGRFRGSKVEMSGTQEPSDEPKVTAEEVQAAQDEEVEFYNAAGSTGNDNFSSDSPKGSATNPKKRGFWFHRPRSRDDESHQEHDIEHGKAVPSYAQEEPHNARGQARSNGRLRSILIVLLALIVLAGVAFGAAYGGFTLSNRNKSSGATGSAPSPAPIPLPETMNSCADDDILLELAIRFDAQPEKVSIGLKDAGSVNSAIWSFPAGSFRSFTQLQRMNFFQICLNPLPSYQLSVMSQNGSGLVSEFAGTPIYGDWELSYNNSVVASYSGDCNNTNATFCGGFSTCDFMLTANFTVGNCSIASHATATEPPVRGSQAPVSTSTPGTNSTTPPVTTTAPGTLQPTIPGSTMAPGTPAPSSTGSTVPPGTAAPSVPGTTSPPQGTAPPQ